MNSRTQRAVFELVSWGLSVRRTCREFGVSEPVLRKHLRCLEGEGFIRRVPGVYPLRFVYTGAGSLVRDLQKRGNGK